MKLFNKKEKIKIWTYAYTNEYFKVGLYELKDRIRCNKHISKLDCVEKNRIKYLLGIKEGECERGVRILECVHLKTDHIDCYEYSCTYCEGNTYIEYWINKNY